jgi:hypothetical protein
MKNKILIILVLLFTSCKTDLNSWLRGPKSYDIIVKIEKIPNSNLSRYYYENDNCNWTAFIDNIDNKYQLNDTIPHIILEEIRNLK